MKRNNKLIFIVLSIFLIVFLTNNSSLNIISSQAFQEDTNPQYKEKSSCKCTKKWSSTKVVSTDSIDDSNAPSIAVDAVGNIHIAWSDHSDYAGAGTDIDIFYKQWNTTSSSWTTTEVVSTESTLGSFYPSLAVDAVGNIHIAWFDYSNYAGAGPDEDIFYKRWDSASSSWTTTEVVSTESTAVSIYPSIAVDSSGNTHITWEDMTPYAGSDSDWDIFYKRWNAISTSWTTTEVVSNGSTDVSSQTSLAIDVLDNIHVVWMDRTDYTGSDTDFDIFYKKLDVSSSSWTITEVVSTDSTDDSYSPSIAVDTSSNIHVAWEDDTPYAGSDTDWDIFYKQWNSATSSWTTTEVVSTESTGKSYQSSLAIDAQGNINIAWSDRTDYAGSGGDFDIFYKYRYTTSFLWDIILFCGQQLRLFHTRVL